MDLTQVTVEVEHVFDAPIEAVFVLLTDVEMMAGLGPEHERAVWLDDGHTRFRGTNRRGDSSWDVECYVIARTPSTDFAFTVGDPARASSTWSYSLQQQGSSTLVRQRFQHGPAGSGLSAVIRSDPDNAQRYIDWRSEEHRTNMLLVLRAAEALLTSETGRS